MTEGYADDEKKMCKLEHTNFQNIEEESFDLTVEIPHICPSSIHLRDPMIDISYAFRVNTKLYLFTYIPQTSIFFIPRIRALFKNII